MSLTAIQIPLCPICGGSAHPGGIATCPKVKEVEYYPDGHIKRVVKNAA